MAKHCCSRKCWSFLLIIIGIALVLSIAVCITTGVFNDLIRKDIDKNMELKPGSESYKNWQSKSSPVYMQYFMFNVTKPKDVENGGKPFVKQLGPYSYREIRRNVPLGFNTSSDTLAYLSQKSYVFDPETSCGGCDPLNDTVFTINIPLLKFSKLIVERVHESIPESLQNLAFDILNDILVKMEPVFVEKTVHDLLWGYNDTLLSDVDYIISEINKLSENKIHIPEVDPVIRLQNNNTNVSSEIHTGVGNIDRLGQYTSWNNLRKLTWWGTKWANMINGTDGSLFRPFISKHDKLYCFVSDICRSLYLTFDSTVTVRDIKLYRFMTPRELFIYTPDVKAGFCVTDNHTCLPNGLLDVSVCQKMGVPIVVSLPHFLFANESVQNEVGGLHPNEEDHATFISVEPNTGITMKTNKRIQVNVAVDKIDEIEMLRNLRKVFLPVMFVNESACIDEHDADKFKKDVYLPINIIKIGKFVVIGVGGLLLIIGLMLLRFRRAKTTKVAEHSIQVDSAAHPDEKTPLTRSLQNYIG